MHLEVSDRQSRFPFSAAAPILFACGSIQAQLTLKGRHESKQGAHQAPNPSTQAGALLAGPQIFARSRVFERYSPLY
jgi:hypothetical protein